MSVSSRLSMRRRDTVAGYLFAGPALVLFIALIAVPMMIAVVMMFFDFDIVGAPSWIGWANIEHFFTDPKIPEVFWTTATLMVPLVLIHSILGLVIAYLVVSIGRRMSAFYRSVIYFPTIVTTVSVAVAWTFLFDTDLGVINYYLELIGIDPVPWLTSSSGAVPAILIFSVWKFIGTPFLFYLIGLQNIPEVYYEAAALDGAGPLKRFFHITLPLLTPTTFMVVVLSFINYLQLFDEPYVLTGGGPGTSSTTVSLYIYRMFQAGEYSYASTIATALFLIVLVVTIVQFAVSKKWVTYTND